MMNPGGYSDLVMELFENPKNVGSLDPDAPNVGTGEKGSPSCGDIMRMQIAVGADGRIEDAKFKTFGCCAAIASSSFATEWLKGKTLAEAETLKNSDLAEKLELPPIKVHCSVLAEDAIKDAIADYRSKNE